jgi:hypothetical protein
METTGFPLVAEVKDAIEILKLNKPKMTEVEARPSATTWGIVMLAVPALLNLILISLAYRVFVVDYLWMAAIPVASSVAMIFALSLIAQKFFQGKGSNIGFFRVAAYASLASWVTVIPYLLMLLGANSFFSLLGLLNLAAGAWMLVVTYHVLMEHHKLTQQNAVITIVIGIVAYVIVSSVLANLLVPYYGLMMF